MTALAAHIANRDGKPRLIINGVEQMPLIYGLTDSSGARWTWEEVPARNLAIFAAAGVRLFQADIWFEQMIGADDRLDLTLARRQVAGVLAVCPEAAVMLRLHVNAPPWWIDRRPEEAVGYGGPAPEPERRWGLQKLLANDNGRPLRASFSSTAWLEWATAHLRAFCAKLAATPEGAAVFGLQIANGVYGEWHQFGFFAHDPDTGPASTRLFCEWAQRHYGDEAALAAAWQQPGLTWAEVRVPDSAARETADYAVLRDPRRGRAVIDYFLFQHERLADVVLHLAGVVKAAWPRPVLTASFFGYYHCLFGRHAAGGHLSLDRVLASPLLDCLCAPQSYEPGARHFGGTGHARGLVDPVRRAGKLWLDEMDLPTSNSGRTWEPGYISDLADDVAMQRRNILQPVTRGGGAWWYDFGPLTGTPDAARYGPTGWWDEPTLQADATALVRIARERTARPYARAADVLVVQDPWSFAHTVSRRVNLAEVRPGEVPPLRGDQVTPIGVDALVHGLHQSGLVHEEVLPGELATLDLSGCRLVIYATAAVLDPAQRRVLRERVARDGRHVVFTGFAGWGDGTAVGPELAADLTGFETRLQARKPAVQTLALDGASESRSLDGEVEAPVFAETGAEVVGRWADGTAAAVTRAWAEAVWWSFALAPTAPAVLRAIGRRAGCRVVNDHDETTLVGAGLLIVHTIAGGTRTLRSPDGPVIEAELPPRSTVVFDAVTGGRLLG